MSSRVIISVIVVVVIVAVGIFFYAKSRNTTVPSANLSPNTIEMKNLAFTPSTLTVEKGTEVTFLNSDSTTHNVVADDNSFQSGNLSGGAEFKRTFDTAGTFPYHCSIHPSMKGKIVVK